MLDTIFHPSDCQKQQRPMTPVMARMKGNKHCLNAGGSMKS